jgi:hypothetical protein
MHTGTTQGVASGKEIRRKGMWLDMERLCPMGLVVSDVKEEEI